MVDRSDPSEKKTQTPGHHTRSNDALNRLTIGQNRKAQNHASFLEPVRQLSSRIPQLWFLSLSGMRQTNQVDRIQVRQDDDGDYWIVITAETGSVGISLSASHQLNPNRIKLEAWAEDQLRRDEQGRETVGSASGS
jgi:hypothetical protein